MRITRANELVRKLICFFTIYISLFGINSYAIAQEEAPVITLYGDENIQISQGDTFVEPQFIAIDANNNDITPNVSVYYPFDINQPINDPRTYTITYDVVGANGLVAQQKIRTLIVKDTEPPVISILGQDPMSIFQGETFNDPGATAVDNVDIPENINITVDDSTVTPSIAGTYSVVYNATDTAGNAASTVVRTVNVSDTEPPVITILGQNPMTIDQGDLFNDPGATANDNVNGNSLTVNSTNNVDETTPGVYEVTYTVTDTANNTSSATRTVNVLDTQPPVITLLGSTPKEINQGLTYSDAGYNVIDNYDAVEDIAVSTTDNVNTSIPGEYTFVYNATDQAGNTAIPKARTVKVLDTEAPVITILGINPYSINQDVTFTDPGASALDNVDGSLTSSIVPTSDVDTSQPGTYTVLYNVMDTALNAAEQKIRNVIVNDTEAPVIEILGANPFTVSQGDNYIDESFNVTDNVDPTANITTTTTGADTVDTNTPGNYAVVYTATDSAGNNAITMTRTVIVADAENPVITITGDNPYFINQDDTYNDEGATAIDNVDGNLTSNIVPSGNVDTSNPGSYDITYTVTDSANNTSTAVRNVIVKDTEPPAIVLRGSSSISIDQGTPYTDADDAGADVSDNVDTNVVLVEENNVNSSIPGTYTYVFSATDQAGNAAVPVTRTVIVNDTTPPVISLIGANPLYIDQNSPSFVDPGVTATDNVDGDLTTAVNTSGFVDTTTAGSYVITYDVQDSNGLNAIQVERTVVVRDKEAPVITVQNPNPFTVNQGAPFIEPGVTATDNVDGNLTANIVPTPTNLNTSVAGTFTITYSVSDAAGNSAIPKSRTVNVQDTEAPVITLLGDSTMEINQGNLFSDPGATATDNVDGNLTANIVPTGTVDVNTPGSYTIRYDVVDSSNITAAPKTRTVIVRDTEFPIITILGNVPELAVFKVVGDVTIAVEISAPLSVAVAPRSL